MTATATPTSLQDRLTTNVRAAMQVRGMNSKQLAELLGTTGPHVSQLLNNRNRMQLYWVERFADALDIDDPVELLA